MNVSAPVVGDDPSSCLMTAADVVVAKWVASGGFLLLIYGMVAMFAGLAMVCDHYFVPALKIFCEEWQIPDSVGGATFMAAGTVFARLSAVTSFISPLLQPLQYALLC
jgi:hypothetical protein